MGTRQERVFTPYKRIYFVVFTLKIALINQGVILPINSWDRDNGGGNIIILALSNAKTANGNLTDRYFLLYSYITKKNHRYTVIIIMQQNVKQ